MRKISATMASQHPDHARKPDWLESPFITVHDEIQEIYRDYFDLGISEYKWDWEGKFVDESVVERLLSTHFDEFAKYPLGQERFLTFRLPNPKVETEFRLGRAFMGILGAAGLAEVAGLTSAPLFEVILPMTESSQEMIDIQEAFQELSSVKHPLLKIVDRNRFQALEIIPLFEQVEVIIESDTILKEYIEYYKNRFGHTPEYIRPYVARSDPALNSGLVPTILAIKIALSRYKKLEEHMNIKMFPVIGSASLPFRGGLTPATVDNFIAEYAGVRTALLQSAFRYDFPKEDVKTAVAKLEELLPQQSVQEISAKEEEQLQDIVRIFEAAYRSVIEDIAPAINTIAGMLPKRRERVQHVGLFGYSRGIGKVKLPRAIGFTAALYSLGVPPEVIGTGRGLHAMVEKGYPVTFLTMFYKNMLFDLQRAARFVNKANIEALARKAPAWDAIRQDITYLETYLGIEFSPETAEEQKHLEVTSNIYTAFESGGSFENLIEEGALLRNSMG